MAEEIEFGGILSKAEFFKLMEATRKPDGKIDESDVEKLVNWAIEKRTGASCVDLLLNGFVKFSGFDSEGMPVFMPHDDEIDEWASAILQIENAELPMLEESRC